MKKFLYFLFVNNRVIDFLSSPFLSIFVPPILGLYYGTLDIWGNDWTWVKNYQDIHTVIFSILAGMTVIILFIKGVAESCKGQVTAKYEKITESMITFFNELVKKKRDRFNNKAKSLKPTGDIFKTITHARDQLEHMLDGTKRFLVSVLGIDQKTLALLLFKAT